MVIILIRFLTYKQNITLNISVLYLKKCQKIIKDILMQHVFVAAFKFRTIIHTAIFAMLV